MKQHFEIVSIQESDFHDLSIMVGELLNEIMALTDSNAFNYDQKSCEIRAIDLVSQGKYWIFLAKLQSTNENIGFVTLYESYALYSEGAYGTIPELYVRPKWRSKSIGQVLLKKVSQFAINKNWHRIEVTTPSLPEFSRTLSFYQQNGFEITGGRKLKLDIPIDTEK